MSLTSITLPPSPTEIGHDAFREYRNLREIVFNNGLIKIGYHAFRDCTSLESITLPSTLVEIGDYAFT